MSRLNAVEIDRAAIIEAMLTEEIVEPPMGRRKARVRCPVYSCDGAMIEGRVMCDPCWRSLPVKFRKAAVRLYREARDPLNELHADLIDRDYFDWCLQLVGMAAKYRTGELDRSEADELEVRFV